MPSSRLDPTGFVHIMPPYCYRCELGQTYPECGLACARQLEETIVKLKLLQAYQESIQYLIECTC